MKSKGQCGGREARQRELQAAGSDSSLGGATNSLPTKQACLYELKSTSTRGLGLFATQDIPAGTKVIDQEPLIIVPCGNGMGNMILQCFCDLSFDSKAQYMALCARKMPEEFTTYEADGAEPGSSVSDDVRMAPHGESGTSATSNLSAPLANVLAMSVSVSGVDSAISLLSVLQFGEESATDEDYFPNHEALDTAKADNTIDHNTNVSKQAYVSDELACGLSDEEQKDTIPDFATPPHYRHDSAADEDATCPTETIYHASDIINIFETNALGGEVGDNLVAMLCLKAARMNHSCVPNVFCTYDSVVRKHTVHAVKDIPAGEEILTSYIAGSFKTKDERQAELRKWGFECACSACIEPAENSMSDARRQRLQKMRQSVEQAKILFKSRELSRDLATDAVIVLSRMIDLMEEEGLINPDLADLCGAAGLCSTTADETIMWLAKKLDIMLICYGSDSPYFQREEDAFRKLFLIMGGDPEDLPPWILLNELSP